MDSPNDDLYKVVPSPSFLVSGIMENQVLFFLRSVQHSAIILSGFTCAYFSYWHTILKDPVPLGLNAFVLVCFVALLENYIFSAISLAERHDRPSYKALLMSSTPCAVAMGAAYYGLRSVPFLGSWSEGDNWFSPIRETEGWKLKPAGVEEHHAALAHALIAIGAIALTFTLFISAFAAMGVWKSRRHTGPRGYAAVGESLDVYDGDTVFEVDDVEKLS